MVVKNVVTVVQKLTNIWITDNDINDTTQTKVTWNRQTTVAQNLQMLVNDSGAEGKVRGHQDSSSGVHEHPNNM